MTKCTKRPNSNFLTGYRTDKCRCDDCTEANTTAMRVWRRKTGRTTMKLVPLGDDD